MKGRSVKQARAILNRAYGDQLKDVMVDVILGGRYELEVRRRLLLDIEKGACTPLISAAPYHVKLSEYRMKFIRDRKLSVYFSLMIDVLAGMVSLEIAVVYEAMIIELEHSDPKLRKILSSDQGKGHLQTFLAFGGYCIRPTTDKGRAIRVLRKIRGTELMTVTQRQDKAIKYAELFSAKSPSKALQGLI